MENERRLGIDTSKFQLSKVDYAGFKRSGGDFVFLRIGCGSTKDPNFEADYASVVAAGLRVGAYFYTYSKTVAGAAQDAARVLGWLGGKALDLPLVYDVEDDVQVGADRRDLNSAMYNSFADAVKAAGYKAMLYTGEFFFNNYFNSSAIAEKPWIAKYSSNQPNIGREVAIWQFSSAEVSETYYKGALDRNYMLSDEWGAAEGSGCGCGCGCACCSGAKEEASVKGHDNPYPVPTTTLYRTTPMMNGDGVKWLQTELKRHGLIENGGVDGWFGDKTLAAVRVYQQQNGLTVDGRVGPATRASLLNS